MAETASWEARLGQHLGETQIRMDSSSGEFLQDWFRRVVWSKTIADLCEAAGLPTTTFPANMRKLSQVYVIHYDDAEEVLSDDYDVEKYAYTDIRDIVKRVRQLQALCQNNFDNIGDFERDYRSEVLVMADKLIEDYRVRQVYDTVYLRNTVRTLKIGDFMASHHMLPLPEAVQNEEFGIVDPTRDSVIVTSVSIIENILLGRIREAVPEYMPPWYRKRHKRRKLNPPSGNECVRCGVSL